MSKTKGLQQVGTQITSLKSYLPNDLTCVRPGQGWGCVNGHTCAGIHGIKRFENDAHAAVPNDADDLTGSNAAELVRIIRRT